MLLLNVHCGHTEKDIGQQMKTYSRLSSLKANIAQALGFLTKNKMIEYLIELYCSQEEREQDEEKAKAMGN